jgi:hypothetical protein
LARDSFVYFSSSAACTFAARDKFLLGFRIPDTNLVSRAGNQLSLAAASSAGRSILIIPIMASMALG